MLRNLLDNAIKYCPEDTIVSVKISSSQIIIEDNGGGVEPEDLKNLDSVFIVQLGKMKREVAWDFLLLCELRNYTDLKCG